MADLFGWDIGTITGGQILPWAIIVFVIGITATIFRHELLLQEVDLLAGNPALRSLYEDGILPTIHDYFNYVRRGDIGIVKRFWDGGIVNVRDPSGRTDLQAAAQTDSVILVRGLIERGCAIEEASPQGLTALNLAVQHGKLSVARELLVLGASPNAAYSSDQTTPLHCAVGRGDIAATDLLLDFGARIDQSDCDQITPLMVAASQNKAECAMKLIERGANVFLRDVYGASALDYANSRNCKDVSERLKALGAPGDPSKKMRGCGFSGAGKLRPKWDRE